MESQQQTVGATSVAEVNGVNTEVQSQPETCTATAQSDCEKAEPTKVPNDRCLESSASTSKTALHNVTTHENVTTAEATTCDPGANAENLDAAQASVRERTNSRDFRYPKMKGRGKKIEGKQVGSNGKVGTPYFSSWQSYPWWIPPRVNIWNPKRFYKRHRTYSDSTTFQEVRCLLEFNERKRVIYIKGSSTRSVHIAIKADPIFNRNICLKTDAVEVYDEMFQDYVECDHRTHLQQGSKLRVRKGILDMHSLEESLPCAVESAPENIGAENLEAPKTDNSSQHEE